MLQRERERRKELLCFFSVVGSEASGLRLPSRSSESAECRCRLLRRSVQSAIKKGADVRRGFPRCGRRFPRCGRWFSRPRRRAQCRQRAMVGGGFDGGRLVAVRTRLVVASRPVGGTVTCQGKLIPSLRWASPRRNRRGSPGLPRGKSARDAGCHADATCRFGVLLSAWRPSLVVPDLRGGLGSPTGSGGRGCRFVGSAPSSRQGVGTFPARPRGRAPRRPTGPGKSSVWSGCSCRAGVPEPGQAFVARWAHKEGHLQYRISTVVAQTIVHP